MPQSPVDLVDQSCRTSSYEPEKDERVYLVVPAIHQQVVPPVLPQLAILAPHLKQPVSVQHVLAQPLNGQVTSGHFSVVRTAWESVGYGQDMAEVVDCRLVSDTGGPLLRRVATSQEHRTASPTKSGNTSGTYGSCQTQTMISAHSPFLSRSGWEAYMFRIEVLRDVLAECVERCAQGGLADQRQFTRVLEGIAAQHV